jgi:hypothetical protein
VGKEREGVGGKGGHGWQGGEMTQALYAHMNKIKIKKKKKKKKKFMFTCEAGTQAMLPSCNFIF